jgi:hypothetical protein
MPLAVAVWFWIAAACAAPTDPADLMSLPPETAAYKAMQTRYFETSSEDELLSASAAVLQDLGFQISESVRDVGFLRATKERSARERGQEISRALIAIFSSFGFILGANTLVLNPVDLHQQINASLLTRPQGEERSRYEVRILFYRIVWKTDGSSGNTHIPPGEQRAEMVRDGGIYQQFFAKLSKAVFLEAHKI